MRDGVQGDALYALVNFQSGSEVVSSTSVTAFSEHGWAGHFKQHGLPEDAAIKVYGTSPSMLTDWTVGSTKPTWYYLNHSSSPNTRVVYHRERRCLAWVATRPITPGQEVTFYYSKNVPAEWAA